MNSKEKERLSLEMIENFLTLIGADGNEYIKSKRKVSSIQIKYIG